MRQAILGGSIRTRKKSRIISSSVPFVGPLDGLIAGGMTAPVAVYALRRMLTSYIANKAIRVRRLSDSAVWDVGFASDGSLDIAGLTAFLAATTGVVTIWYDQSPASVDLIQATLASQPAINISDAIYSGDPSIGFAAASTQSIDRATTPITAFPCSVYVRASVISTAASGSLISVGDGTFTTRILALQSAAAQLQAFSVQSGAATASATPLGIVPGVQFHGTGILVNNSSRAAYLAGGNKGTNSTAKGPSAATQIAVGRSGTGGFLDGTLGMVLIWNVALSDAQVAALENF